MDGETQTYRYRRRLIYRDWLTHLWKSRSPIVCCLQIQEPGKLVMQFSLGPEAEKQKHREAGKRRWIAQLKWEKWVHSSSTLLFYSSPQQIGGPRWSSLSLPTHMPISCRDTLTDTPKNGLWTTWASLIPAKLTHKINHHMHQQFSLNCYCLDILLIILLKPLNSTASHNPDSVPRSLIS